VGDATIALPKFSPSQMEVRNQLGFFLLLGLDVARAVLGHRSPQVTELYAELDLARAAEAMAKMG
jgi:hypothetical protein